MALNYPNDFVTGWYGTDLGRYRLCNSTYCFYRLEAQAPILSSIAELSSFSYLRKKAIEYGYTLNTSDEQSSLAKKLNALRKELEEKSNKIPAEFKDFFDQRLDTLTDSVTACYFDISDAIISSPIEGDEGYFIRFLNDQQGVLFWYLYIDKEGANTAVIVSKIYLDDPTEYGQHNLQQHHYQELLIKCAYSFPEFIFRYAIENNIWGALEDAYGGGDPKLNEEEAAYLNHYKIS